jgi:hypothetical protein
LSGRNPFRKDSEVFNYEYDSEAEWEEEEEGEDIENSDGESEDADEEEGEDKRGANELMYDDFFLRDNDFGSDADSDGEDRAGAIIKPIWTHLSSVSKWNSVDVCGPVFMTYSSAEARDEEAASSSLLGHADKNIQRMRQYSSVILTPLELFPFLSEVELEKNLSPALAGDDSKPEGSDKKADKDKWDSALVNLIYI